MMPTVYPQVEVLTIVKDPFTPAVVKLAFQFVDESGKVKHQKIRNLMEGDIVIWKNFIKEYDY